MNGIVDLGDRIAERWEARNYGEAAFSEIATTELRDSGILDALSLRDVTAWFMTSRQLPPQVYSPFGDPPIRVYQGRAFRIELLVWVDTPTAIHQHSFSGAFGILLGSSFHSEYRFHSAERIGEELALGTLALSSAELLRRGDVRTIRSGEGFIHSLLHLEAPTISVVVRTTAERRFAPQLQYFPPGLAIDPFHRPEPLRTQIELMRTLLRVQPALFSEIARESMRNRDLFFAYHLLEAVSKAGDLERLNELLALLRTRHAAFSDILGETLAEERRQSSLRRLLTNVLSAEHRYLLALLISAPNRAVVNQMMQARFPASDPEAKMLELIEELSNSRCAGLTFDNVSLRLLRFAMHGSTFDDLVAAFRKRFGDRDLTESLSRRWNELHAADALRPILATSSLSA